MIESKHTELKPGAGNEKGLGARWLYWILFALVMGLQSFIYTVITGLLNFNSSPWLYPSLLFSVIGVGFLFAAIGAVFVKRHSFWALPRLLKQNGYSTLVTHANQPSFWNREHMFRALGFDRFVSSTSGDLELDDVIGWSGYGLSDRSMLGQMSKILTKTGQPFLLDDSDVIVAPSFREFPRHT